MNLRPLLLACGAMTAPLLTAAAQGAAGFDIASLHLPPGFLRLSDLALVTEADGAITVTAKTTLLNAETRVLATVLPRGTGRPDLLLGLKPQDWSLSKSIPGLANPVLDGLTLSHVTLVLSNRELVVGAAQLSDEAYDFYREVYAQDDFTLILKPGINLIAAIPAEGLPPDHPLRRVMDALGIEKGTVLLQGSLGKNIAVLTGGGGGGGGGGGAIKDLYLRAELPPMHPPGSPDWFQSGQLALELTGAPSVRLVGSMRVKVQEDTLAFFLAAALARTGISLSGGMEAVHPWVAPFGIQWLTLDEVILQLALTPTGSVQLGFAGKAIIGKKDIDVAVAIAVSPVGVPTNFMMRGQSEAGFGLSDLVELQRRMAAARDAAAAAAGAAPPAAGPMIPLDALPNIAFRSLALQFAPKPDLELHIEQGMKLKGRMWIPAAPAPDTSMTDFAGVDVGVTNDGLWARGDLGAFKLGPLTWQDAKLDLTATRQDQHFQVSGDVELFSAHQKVDVSLSRTGFEFHTVSELYGLFHATLDASSKFDLKHPSFTIDGVVDNDFGAYVQPILRTGVERFATGGQAVVQRAATALAAVQEALARSQATAAQLRAVLETQRAGAERAWQGAQARADQARASAAAALAATNSAKATWQSTPARQIALKAARRATWLSWAATYAARAAAYASLETIAAAGRRVLDALPPVDRNVLLLAADTATALIRGRLEVAQGQLTAIKSRLDAILAAVATGEDLFTVEHAEIHAGLDALLRGQAANWKITGTFVGQPYKVERTLDFSEPARAVADMLKGLIGAGA
jgi:hypothetical protein